MNVTLILAEGAHDVAFLGKILCGCSDIKKSPRSLSQLPSPLGTFFGKRIARLAIGDYRLDQALSVGMPRLEAAYETNDSSELWLLMKCGGDEKHEDTLTFLREFQAVLSSPLKSVESASSEAINSIRIIHVFDADAEDKAPRLARFNQAYKDFYTVEFAASETFNPSSYCNGGVMCCIVGGEANIKTLEDIVLPLAKKQHAAFIQATDDLLSPSIAGTSLRIKDGSKFKKALLTITGQFAYPGASLAAILGGGDQLHTRQDVQQCPRCTAIFKAVTRRTEWT